MESKPDSVFSTARNVRDNRASAAYSIQKSIKREEIAIESSGSLAKVDDTRNNSIQNQHQHQHHHNPYISPSSSPYFRTGIERNAHTYTPEVVKRSLPSLVKSHHTDNDDDDDDQFLYNSHRDSPTAEEPVQKKAKRNHSMVTSTYQRRVTENENNNNNHHNEEAMKDGIIRRICTNSTYELSEEQINILKTVQPPNVGGRKGSIIRITAAAGTGKTETMLKLSQVAAGIGHELITYATFNKAAAKDGHKRFAAVFEKFPNQQERATVEVKTIHSCAMQQLTRYRNVMCLREGRFLKNNNELLKVIEDLCGNYIEDFLVQYRNNISMFRGVAGDVRKIDMRMQSAKKRVYNYLLKNLVSTFCGSKSTREEFGNPRNKYRVYFPARKYHQGIGLKHGFEGYNTESKIGWYADTTAKLWDMMDQKGLRTFDLEMKRAQLLKLRIPGSCILVDESQDCNACQIDWLAHQERFGCQVYFVGDAAQTIYSFRGAKSKNLMMLKTKQSCTLTQSWRFGPAIARMANLVLFAKENSPQTTSNHHSPMWEPYRVTGNGIPNDIVTTMPIATNWKSQKVTIIARGNATLLKEAMKLLKFNSDNVGGHDEDYECEGYSSCLPLVSQSQEETSGMDIRNLPKIHINGFGGSGLGKWRNVISEINSLFSLYMDSIPPMVDEESEGHDRPTNTPRLLNPKIFPEFEGEAVTWDQFIQRVEAQELTNYTATLSVIHSFGPKTLEAIDYFKSMVLDAKYNADEADVILSTTHAAKGQEWDNVQICDDFVELEVAPPGTSENKYCETNCSRTNKRRMRYQFSVKHYGDDLNLLYVAFTRSKKVLSVPRYLQNLLKQCDQMNDWISNYKDLTRMEDDSRNIEESIIDPPPDFSEVKNSTTEMAFAVFDDIINKLRHESGVGLGHERERLAPLYFNVEEEDVLCPEMYVVEQ